MSYKLKKLSDNDKKILDTIFIELEKIHIPTSYRSNPKFKFSAVYVNKKNLIRDIM